MHIPMSSTVGCSNSSSCWNNSGVMVDFTNTIGRRRGRLSYNRLDSGALDPRFDFLFGPCDNPIPEWSCPPLNSLDGVLDLG